MSLLQAAFVDSRQVEKNRKEFVDMFGEELAAFLLEQIQRDAK